MAGVRRGAFTCVGWQATLCDPIRQVTLRSSVLCFRSIKSYTHLYVYLFTFGLTVVVLVLTFWSCFHPWYTLRSTKTLHAFRARWSAAKHILLQDEPCKIRLLTLTTPDACDVSCGFITRITSSTRLYDSEHTGSPPQLLPLIKANMLCGKDGRQSTRMTCSELYICRSAGFPRTGGAAQDVHVTPGYGLWKPTFSRSTTD